MKWMNIFFSSKNIASFDARLFDNDDDAVDHVDVNVRLGYCSDTDRDYLK